MSASKNPDAVSNQQGQFGSHIAGSEPLEKGGHKPGVLVGNDAAPEFHAQTLPPGSAPSDRTFTPNPVSETPGQANNDLSARSHGKESTQTSSADTLGGATSADVHTGLGKPMQGQTSSELRKDAGEGHAGQGNTGVSGAKSELGAVDERLPGKEGQRAMDREEGGKAGTKGDKGGEYGAGEMPNVTAEEAAAEISQKR